MLLDEVGDPGAALWEECDGPLWIHLAAEFEEKHQEAQYARLHAQRAQALDELAGDLGDDGLDDDDFDDGDLDDDDVADRSARCCPGRRRQAAQQPL